MAMAIDPPERELSRFALKNEFTFSPLMKASMNWRLVMPVKGVYSSHRSLTAINKPIKAICIRLIPDSLKVNKYTMPYRAFRWR